MTWTGWSSIDELRFQYDSGRPDAAEPLNWDDALRYAGGVQYTHPNKRLVLRAGLAYDEAPVRSADSATAGFRW